MKRVAVGMSGGVDSSVVAGLLKEQGYDVVGLTMKLMPDSPESDDAAKVAEVLGIEHHTVDFSEIFGEMVVDGFIDEYKRGRTPNPCIACNRFLKFGALMEHAVSLGADYVATGHYARIEEQNGRFLLKKSHAKKDQSYVLYHLTQQQLRHILLPVSGMEKSEVRTHAERLLLPVAQKSDSQDICFVPDGDYAGFIKRYTGLKFEPGCFIDENGSVLGEHKGIIHYTIGQRKGLGVSFGEPLYVTKIDAQNNTVTLGKGGGRYSAELYADDLNFIPFDRPDEPFRAEVKIRYNDIPKAATVQMTDKNTAKVEFDEPRKAITAGQAAVFYDGDTVVGGGTIQ